MPCRSHMQLIFNNIKKTYYNSSFGWSFVSHCYPLLHFVVAHTRRHISIINPWSCLLFQHASALVCDAQQGHDCLLIG